MAESTSVVDSQQPNQLYRSMAIVSLGSMCLSTTLLHVYLNSFLWTAAFEQMNEKTLSAFPIFGGLGFLWGKFGMKQWLSQLYDISPLMRNNSMIGGLVASTVGLIYVLLTIPSPSLQTYAAYTLWPTYVGLIIGAVAARFFESFHTLKRTRRTYLPLHEIQG